MFTGTGGRVARCTAGRTAARRRAGPAWVEQRHEDSEDAENANTPAVTQQGGPLARLQRLDTDQTAHRLHVAIPCLVSPSVWTTPGVSVNAGSAIVQDHENQHDADRDQPQRNRASGAGVPASMVAPSCCRPPRRS